MKLVTFQSLEALKCLVDNGRLVCDSEYVNREKIGVAYEWVKKKMNNQIEDATKGSYPIWCWVKCYGGICPPARKGVKVNGFDVKITFHKAKEDVFTTDYRRYSFLLNNVYIPASLEDKNKFEKKLLENNITEDDLKAYVRRDKYESHRTDEEFYGICREIEKSFDRCITDNSNVLQGCVWNISLKEVEKIEILDKDDGYAYGTLNYIRKNGERKDWIRDFYKTLK